MNYYLQCNCSENSRQKLRCSRRRCRQNGFWLLFAQ